MDIFNFMSIFDTLSEFSFKDVLSLAAIGYQLIKNRPQEASPTDSSEISDFTSDETSTTASQSSLISIAKDNTKNKIKALIQKARRHLKRKAGIGILKISLKRSKTD